MGELTPEARAAIADSVRIVREDRFESFVKSKWPKTGGEPPTDEPSKDDKTPPKKTEDPTKDEPPKRRSAYWGILDDDTD